MSQFEYYDTEKVSSQIEELQKYAEVEIDINKKVAFLRTVLLTKQNAMDLRYEAVEQLDKIIKERPKLVIPVFIEFLETDESQHDDQNYIKAQYREMTDPFSYKCDDYDEYWFSDLKELVIAVLDPNLPETKEAIYVLVKIVKEEFFEDFADAAQNNLLRLGELYQDIRYILDVHLREVCEYNASAKLVINYLDEYYN